MAFYRKKSFRKYSRKGPKRTYKRKSYAKKTPAIKRMIKKEIARNVEDKTIQMFDFQRVLRSTFAGDFDAVNIIPLGPDPSSILCNQGTGQGGRIGNRIKTKKLTLKGVLSPAYYDGVTNPGPTPMQVKMWIFYDRRDPNALPQVLNAGDFFQNGNSARSFNTDLTDMVMPVNTDRYRVFTTRTFKLGYAQFTGGSGTNAPSGFYANNDFKLNATFNIDLTKYYPKDVRFEDNSALPTTRGLYCMWVVVPANSLPAENARPCFVQYCQDYRFEDA